MLEVNVAQYQMLNVNILNIEQDHRFNVEMALKGNIQHLNFELHSKTSRLEYSIWHLNVKLEYHIELTCGLNI